MKARIRFAAVCILLAPLARADVIVVDPHGGPGAAQLQAALDAAKDGDILLLRDGDYSSLTPPAAWGKSLVVVADAGQDITLPGLSLTGLQPGGLAVVRGLRMHVPSGVMEVGLTATSMDVVPGGLWVEDCDIAGSDLAYWQGVPWSGTVGLSCGNLAFAVVTRSQLTGGRGRDAGQGPGGEPLPAMPGNEACWLDDAGTVSLSALDARGGDGGNGPADAWQLANGGHAVTVISSSVEVQGGTYIGGDEGLDNSALTEPGSAFRFTSASAGLRDVVAQPGAVHGAGTPAPTILEYNATVENRPAPARVLVIDSPVREFGSVDVHVAGQPGDLAWLLLSNTPGGKVLSGKQGAFMLETGLPVLPVLLGPTDSAGVLNAASHLPALPSGTDGTVLFAQLVVLNGGSVLLGTPSALVWISASF